MKSKIEQTDLGIVIGRFQPFHKGHLELVRTALQFSKTVLILVGSSNRARSPDNPFRFEERRNMIIQSLAKADDIYSSRLRVQPLEDYLYEDNRWLEQVQRIVEGTAGEVNAGSISLFGHDRDETSWYIKKFPQWNLVELPAFHDDISATEIREHLFGTDTQAGSIKKYVPEGTFDILRRISPKIMTWIKDDYMFADAYYKAVNVGPYEYIRHTVDAVVTCKGHILLVKRKNYPGMGLWALPGGHIDSGETLEKAVIRELYEETGIGVKVNVLWNSMQGEKNFGHPKRSCLCRTITTAFHFPLNTGDLPLLEEGDDAAKAKWFTFNDFNRLRSDGELFEDHGDIGSYYIRQH